MAKVTKQDLLSAFERGKKPTQQDFANFIESTYSLSDIEFHGSGGQHSGPVKLLAGITQVANNEGLFEISYGNIQYTQVVVVMTTPLHSDTLPNEAENVISANIILRERGRSVGKAFLSGDTGSIGSEFNAPAPIGSRIQYFVILI